MLGHPQRSDASFSFLKEQHINQIFAKWDSFDLKSDCQRFRLKKDVFVIQCFGLKIKFWKEKMYSFELDNPFKHDL